MADRLWRAQVTSTLDSGIPEDVIVNTLYFDDDDDPVAAPEDTAAWIFTKVNTFFDSVQGAACADTLSGNRTVRLYDMADPEPRPPIFTQVQTIPAIATEPPLPSEVAICLSFAAAVGDGDIVARRRGRLYIGPIRQDAAVVIGSQSRPSLEVREALRDAMLALATPFEHPASPGFALHWSVYSPTTHAAEGVGPAFNDVISGWVDDAFDTQRRRGCDATARVTFAV